MKANIDAKSRRIAREEYEKMREKYFRELAPDITAQNIAFMLWTMHTRFGWGAKRIRRLIEAFHDTEDLMENPSRLHHRFSPLECEEILKEKYGVDIRKEFPPKVEVKP